VRIAGGTGTIRSPIGLNRAMADSAC
jgi:hypothetical protein